MTTHDDPNLEPLDHDLKVLAAPREDDERLRLALRAHLLAAARPQSHMTDSIIRPRMSDSIIRTPARRRLRVRFALGATVGVAAAAIAVGALVGTSGSGGPGVADAAIVHRALQAVTPPPNKILHTEVVGVQNGESVMAQSWQETSAPYANRGMKGDAAHHGEFSDDGQNSFGYDPTTNTIYEQPDTSHPTFTDPAAQVRQLLDSGQAHEVGTAVIEGVALYKIDLPHGLIGYFAQGDYRPRYLDDPQRDGSVVRLRVAAYEYLPMTPANRALLSVVAQHPGARIVRGSGPGFGK
jgi:hypothetical protein